MSLNDLSRISDLSDISQISHSTTRIVNRTDSVQSLLDCHVNKSRSRTNSVSTNYLEKTIKSLVSCEESIVEYIKQKVIFECVKESGANKKKTLSEDVANKLRGLMQIHEMKKYMYLPPTQKNSQEELTTLGIMNLPKYELKYEEKLSIKCYTETLLREMIHDIISRYENSGGTVKEVMKSSEVSARNQLVQCRKPEILNWKEKIEELSSQYENNILKCANLLNTWRELKYKDQTELNLAHAQYLLLQVQVAEVQAKISKLSCVMRMFKETPTTVDAFKALGAAVEEKLYAVTEEVRKKKELKKLYDDLKNTEYDEVLKSYLHICNAIKKKEHILQML